MRALPTNVPDLRLLLVVAFFVALWPYSGRSATVWTGPPLTFSKVAFADPTESANQDRLTDDVWLTRGDIKGLFNIAQEASFAGDSFNSPSPLDTEWAVGTTAELGSLTFQTWSNALGQNPPGAVFAGQDFVLHLIRDDIYIDIRFIEWGIGDDAGGSFAYIRSTPFKVPEPSLLGLALIPIFMTSLMRKKGRTLI